MAKQDSSSGLMSSAGLVRYFESEDNQSIRIDPKTITALSFLAGCFVIVLNTLF